MFTGIVAAVGSVRRLAAQERGARAFIASGELPLDDVRIGDSIAVNGCCLTVTALESDGFHVDLSQETIDRIVGFEPGARVNLEKSLRLADRLGGHLVTGHVDGRGELTRFEPVGESRLMEVRVGAELARYIALKGSVTVNGVSLTVNKVDAEHFDVNLIPHTLAVTNLGQLGVGSAVNIEIDLLARYIERLMQTPR